MGRKKILIVSRPFYPVIAPRAFRATELAKEFARQGHAVTVLTHKRDFDHSDFISKHKILIEDFAFGKWKEIGTDTVIARAARRAMNRYFLYPDIQLAWLVKNALKNYTGYDLLISLAIPYPVHWGVALARETKKELARVWVADCGDPFMGNKEQRELPFYFRYVEKWFCKKPDYISVPVPEAIDAYPSACREKIRVIPQGFNFSEIPAGNTTTANKRPCFAYAGALHTEFRNPAPFLEHLCTLNDVDFKFSMYTRNISIVEPYKKILNDKLHILDYVPREQLLQDFCTMDFLVNFENSNNVQKPSKLIDYVLLGKPILSIKHNNLDTRVVAEFLAGNYTNKLMVENIEQYDIKNVVNAFLATLDGV